MFRKKDKKRADQSADQSVMSVHIIGNENAALIVSNKGHFDFRVNKKSVFGKVFDPKNRGFIGKSPVFIISCGNKRIKFKYERVESTTGRISLISSKITVCFTVDTQRKELLAMVNSNAEQKEYVLCVSGQRIAVNSYDFDKICEKLSKATKAERSRHRIYTDDNDAQRLYLFACFWDLDTDHHLTKFWSAKDFNKLVNNKRSLCVALPGAFSDKALNFAKSMLRYSRYIKNTFGMGTDLAFYDPKGEFSRFFEQNKLKKYIKEEFELLCACSCGVIELALDFDSKVILYDLTSKALVFEDSADRDEASNSDNKKIAELRTGIMRAALQEKNIGSVSFSFGDLASIDVYSLRLIARNDQKRIDISKNMTLERIYAGAVTYCYGYNGFEGEIIVGTDTCLPFFLMYAEKIRQDLDFGLKFSFRSAGVELTSKMIRVTNTRFATIFMPMIYEKEKICLFVIKNEDESGCSIVIGAFLSQKDAMLYKAMEKYPDTRSVKSALDKLKSSNETSASLVCNVLDDPCHRIERAISVCKKDHKKAKSHIIWALCSQNIDGSLLCDGSAALALALYLEKSHDKEILFLELPYTFEGRFTSRKENVFMHVMRAAEFEYNTEDKNALEYLRKIYYEADQL